MPSQIEQKTLVEPTQQALTGGKVNYYLVQVDHPQRASQAPYQAECEDIIHALGMTFDEGCLFKELWRSANARKGNGKPGHTALYGAQKMVHYANRILAHLQNQEEKQKREGQEDLSIPWTTHIGNGRPPDLLKSQFVRVKLRCGNTLIGRIRHFNWFQYNHGGDVIAYYPV